MHPTVTRCASVKQRFNYTIKGVNVFSDSSVGYSLNDKDFPNFQFGKEVITIVLPQLLLSLENMGKVKCRPFLYILVLNNDFAKN